MFFKIKPNRLAAKKRGAFEALTCPPVKNLATKNEPGVYHYPPHVFLGAVGVSFFYFIQFISIEISHCQTMYDSENEKHKKSINNPT